MTVVVLLLLIGLIGYIFNSEIATVADPTFLVEHMQLNGCGTTLLLLLLTIVLLVLSLFG